MKMPWLQLNPMFAALKRVLLLLATGLALALASCSKAPGPTVLARVGDRQITVDDFRSEVERRIKARRTLPDKETLLQEMVEYEALAQRARKSGLLEDPQVQREINNLLIGKLQDRDLATRLAALEVSERDVQAEYEKNLAKYTRPAKVRLALLFLEANSKMSEMKRREVRSRMEDARARFLENPVRETRGAVIGGFGPLAIEYSDEQTSRYRGGDLGWLDDGNYAYRWPRAVLETGYTLPKHELSEVIETEQGYYLVMKTDFRDGHTTPLAEVAAAIRQSLLVRGRQELNEAFRQESLRMAAARTDQAALKSVEMALPNALASASNRQAEPPALPFTAEPHGN